MSVTRVSGFRRENNVPECMHWDEYYAGFDCCFSGHCLWLFSTCCSARWVLSKTPKKQNKYFEFKRDANPNRNYAFLAIARAVGALKLGHQGAAREFRPWVSVSGFLALSSWSLRSTCRGAHFDKVTSFFFLEVFPFYRDSVACVGSRNLWLLYHVRVKWYSVYFACSTIDFFLVSSRASQLGFGSLWRRVFGFFRVSPLLFQLLHLLTAYPAGQFCVPCV